MTEDAEPKLKPKRILHATKVGPFAMLKAMRRCHEGESAHSVAKDIGISHQTLMRWYLEHSREVIEFQEALDACNTGDAYRSTAEMARHVAECDYALRAIEQNVRLERQKLERLRRKWASSPIMAKAARLTSSHVTTR